MVVVVSVIIGIGWLTWVKTIGYPIAAREVAKGSEAVRQGNFQASLDALDRAIDLAPDVSSYYNYRATGVGWQ